MIDGWNLTGDTGMMDADGYFYYAARSDDIIVSSGYNIAGPEVEGVLLQHPDVQDCAVVGVPDSERGQIVKAWVVTRCGVFADAPERGVGIAVTAAVESDAALDLAGVHRDR